MRRRRSPHDNSRDHPSHQRFVLDGLNALRKREELIDITLTVEGQEFKAHKVVLSACSDYFRVMFTSNMMEAHRNVIQLNGMNAKGFLLLLEYAYTSKITLDLSNVQDVLEAASHVQILALIQTCSSYLEDAINIDNCVDITTIAETYSLAALKMKVYRFMNQNLSNFSKKREFYTLSPSQLEALLAYDLPVDCLEYDVLKIVVNWFFYKANTISKKEINEAAKIFRHINFSYIPRGEINTTLQEINKNCDCDGELHRILVSEIYNQLKTKDGDIPTNLLNRRGMELALLKIGGFGARGITNEISYKFCSKTKWKNLTRIPQEKQVNFGTAVLNNELFIIGGCLKLMREKIHPFGFKYNTLQDKWSTLSSMRVKRCKFSLLVADGKMYAVGGVTELEEFFMDSITNTCECYDPVTNQWTFIKSLPARLARHAGATYKYSATSKLFICGGIEKEFSLCQKSMYCYETNIDEWTVCTPMLAPRADHVVLIIENFLYVCGGWQQNIDNGHRTPVDTIDVYDVEKDCWTVKTKMPAPRLYSGIVCISEKIYFIGGLEESATPEMNANRIECYDIENDFWSTENRYPDEIHMHTCALLYIPKRRDDMEVMPQSADNCTFLFF